MNNFRNAAKALLIDIGIVVIINHQLGLAPLVQWQNNGIARLR